MLIHYLNIPFWSLRKNKIFHSLQEVERLNVEVEEADQIYFEVYLPVVANRRSE